MATRAEQKHADDQRVGRGPKKKKIASKKPPNRGHVARKASVALEETVPGNRPSRKSTRKSANHAKADAPMNGREGLIQGSSKARFTRDQAQHTRARAHSG